MGLLIATEAMLFSILLVSYLYLRFSDTPSWPPPGVEVPKLLLPTIMTVLLVASSIPTHLGVRRARAGETSAARVYFAISLVLGAAFLTLQGFEYHDKLEHLSPRDNAYGTMFYTITSFHALHLIAGMALLVWGILQLDSATDLGSRTVDNVGFYWHFVDVVWVAVFGILYLPVVW
jgi:heme/copper-type cytochrome/quinol oxidase subunit 3